MCHWLRGVGGLKPAQVSLLHGFSLGAVLQLSTVSIPGSKDSISLQFLLSITVIDSCCLRSDCLISVTHICFHIAADELETSAWQWLGRQVQQRAAAGYLRVLLGKM